MGVLDKLAKLAKGNDRERLEEELAAYREEVEHVIKPGIKNAKSVAKQKGRNVTLYKLHKRSAYVEEWYDKCPRWNAYLFWARLILMWPWIALYVVRGLNA